jgi:LPXTG-site transpeptidase (sortase) family protein
MIHHLRVCLTLLIIVLFTPGAYVQASAKSPSPVLFRETGHTLGYAFQEFYVLHGALSMFGYPLTEVFAEDGRPVQYFERARMEWHADLGLVQVGHLGRWAVESQQMSSPFQPVARPDPSTPNQDYFVETQHVLAGAFRGYWQAHGGLPVFGYPLSEEFTERNTEDGRDYTVQYFERARFEFHPDLSQTYQVTLGHLGRHYLAQHPAPEWASARVTDVGAAWAAVRPTRVVVNRIGLDTEVSEASFSLGTWDVPRYTAAHYWPIAAFPGTVGNIVVAGHVGYRDTIFNHLPQIHTGDDVTLYVGSTQHRYVVREVLTLLPQDTWVMQPTSAETLTLITCVPIGIYSHRLVVRAEPVRG